ncbi:hypothetical protein V6N11_043982 [Hibiscus sabdariffa]|uniref:RNase H type-1 domain-containing protein n=1 Tax=Hibiscus sabdariffa TaxID=183260 RepID=A0ABR2RDV4_9ROSI
MIVFCRIGTPLNSCVADWVSASGGWDWDRLRHIVSFCVLPHIVACPVPNSLLSDYVPCWRWTTKRAFTTKLAFVALGCRKLIIETDSADVADLFSDRHEDLHGNTITSTVRQMLNLNWEVKVCKISRVCNRVVDALAKASHGLPVGEIMNKSFTMMHHTLFMI